ncbi:hypothetical protein Ate01nite_28210 [Actinoplanes teichomyceticus]|nr:hypothetical protein Ate01nite_28210 [Actinoplanes teichomyceticus]
MPEAAARRVRRDRTARRAAVARRPRRAGMTPNPADDGHFTMDPVHFAPSGATAIQVTLRSTVQDRLDG